MLLGFRLVAEYIEYVDRMDDGLLTQPLLLAGLSRTALIPMNSDVGCALLLAGLSRTALIPMNSDVVDCALADYKSSKTISVRL